MKNIKYINLLIIFSFDKIFFLNKFNAIKKCRKCADGFGMCFGPRICCGPDIGCLIDTQESLICRLEDLKSSKACTPYGKQCNKLEYGRCATKNLCCSPGK